MEESELRWKILEKEDAKATFIFEQARDHLEKIIYVSDQIENKAFTILGFSFVLMNGLIAYVATKYCALGFLLVPCLIYIGILFITNVLLLFVVKLTAYHMIGSPPELLLQNDILEQSMAYLIIGQAETYTQRIKQNKEQNHKKEKLLNIATLLLVGSPIFVCLFTYFILLF